MYVGYHPAQNDDRQTKLHILSITVIMIQSFHQGISNPTNLQLMLK